MILRTQRKKSTPVIADSENYFPKKPGAPGVPFLRSRGSGRFTREVDTFFAPPGVKTEKFPCQRKTSMFPLVVSVGWFRIPPIGRTYHFWGEIFRPRKKDMPILVVLCGWVKGIPCWQDPPLWGVGP